MDTEKLLQLKNVQVQYGGVRALDEVDVYLNEGEIVALIGPNGAGKSTILKAVFGLAPIQKGRVFWREDEFVPVPHAVVERGIAFVTQGRRVFSSMTVRENLEIGGFSVRNKRLVDERVTDMLDLFPALKAKCDEASGSLSGGQQQQLAIALGLMTDPKVLLLDEPSLGLAPKIVKEVFALVKAINEKRRTAIMVVEHNMKSLLEISHRGYLLDRGRVVIEGTPKELISSGVLERVFTGTL